MKILVVDDNAQYREAFKRAILLEGYEACEASHAEEALLKIQSEPPDVVVTDLQMRTEREGLDLIEILKAFDPLMPVIMISGVGSFEEGALATRLGAAHVIHKSSIEEEMEGFFEAIRAAHEAARRGREQLALIARAREESAGGNGAALFSDVKALLTDPDVDPAVRGEAYDLIAAVSEQDLLRESEGDMRAAAATAQFEEMQAAALTRLRAAIPEYDALAEDSRKALATAEYLYGMQDEGSAGMDLSRSIAFSYCFAVETEARARLKGKITRLGSDRMNQRIFEACLERKSRCLDLEFQQQLLQAARSREIKFTMDNIKHVLLGLIHRKERYKPDGLKDVGILLLCFARHYSFHKWGKTLQVKNPMRVKGLTSEDDIVGLAGLLIKLQYARNPYIHPDVHKREQLTALRQIAFDCLNELTKVL